MTSTSHVTSAVLSVLGPRAEEVGSFHRRLRDEGLLALKRIEESIARATWTILCYLKIYGSKGGALF